VRSRQRVSCEVAAVMVVVLLGCLVMEAKTGLSVVAVVEPDKLIEGARIGTKNDLVVCVVVNSPAGPVTGLKLESFRMSLLDPASISPGGTPTKLTEAFPTLYPGLYYLHWTPANKWPELPRDTWFFSWLFYLGIETQDYSWAGLLQFPQTT